MSLSRQTSVEVACEMPRPLEDRQGQHGLFITESLDIHLTFDNQLSDVKDIFVCESVRVCVSGKPRAGDTSRDNASTVWAHVSAGPIKELTCWWIFGTTRKQRSADKAARLRSGSCDRSYGNTCTTLYLQNFPPHTRVPSGSPSHSSQMH